MRRLFWCSAAVIVAAAAAVYGAAEYAQQHPGSFLARCSFATYHLMVEYNPLSRAGHVVAARVPRATQGVAVPACTGAATCTADHGQSVRGEAAEPAVLGELFSRDAFTNLSRCQAPATLTSDLQEPCQGPPSDSLEGPASISGEAPGLTVQAGGVEESEDSPPTMPLSRDDDGDAPAVMPYIVDSDDDSAQLFNYWMGLFRKAAGQSNEGQQPGADTAAGSSEESESMYGNVPADCREDPAYNYQYPGCPYTGTCPKGRGRLPTAKPQVAPKLMGDLEEQSPLPDSLVPQLKPVETKPDADSDDESPLHPDVDTMEFRHSDAHDGEFDPHPM
jgi:hypothetical protein